MTERGGLGESPERARTKMLPVELAGEKPAKAGASLPDPMRVYVNWNRCK